MDKTNMTEVEKQAIRDQVLKGQSPDKLKEIFKMQAELDAYIREQHADKMPKGISEWVMKLTIAMESEIDEIRREVNWKWWKPEKQIDIEKLRGEVIDMWHFLISMSQRVGLSSDDVFRVYEAKREENFARQRGQSKDGEAYDYSAEGGNTNENSQNE